jgi:hypothetical protein
MAYSVATSTPSAPAERNLIKINHLRGYCLWQAESIVNKPINGEEGVNFVDTEKRSSK